MAVQDDRVIWLTGELVARGMTDRSIAAAVRDRRLFRVDRGVYTTRFPDDLLTLRALAARHPELTYCGTTAAFLYGIGTLSWPAQGRVPANRSRNGGRLLTLRSGTGAPARTVHGVRVVTPVQLVAELGDGPGIAGLLERQYSGVKGNDRLEKELAALTRGRTQVTAVLDTVVTGTASRLELRAVRAIRAALDGVPVTVQVNRMVRGYRFDIVIEEARVLVEIDSFTFHAGDRASQEGFIRDRWKGNMATRWGWHLLRYSDDCVDHARAEMAQEVADTVRFLLKYRKRRRREDEALATDRPVWSWHRLL